MAGNVAVHTGCWALKELEGFLPMWHFCYESRVVCIFLPDPGLPPWGGASNGRLLELPEETGLLPRRVGVVLVELGQDGGQGGRKWRAGPPSSQPLSSLAGDEAAASASIVSGLPGSYQQWAASQDHP